MSDSAVIPWERFSHDPRESGNASLRASDADRNVALDILSNGYADGRVDQSEYDERSTTLTGAKTLGELVPPIRDLAPDHASLVSRNPELLQAQAEDRYKTIRTQAFAGFLGPSLVCWVIWAVSGFGVPWPLFVSLGTIAAVSRVVTNRRGIIENEKRKIQREELRAIERKPR